jgi:histone deacetylase 1/2
VGCRPIGLKWVYKVKHNERGAIIKYKARLIARRFVQREGIDFEERIKLSKLSTAAKVDATRYRSIVGGLRWLTHTWPEIAFTVGYVSRFMEDPQEDHWTAVKRLLRYIKGSLDQAVVFPKHGGLQLKVFSEALPKFGDDEPGLTVFSDADMAGNIDGRRSTSGVLVFLRSVPIAW